MRKLRLLAFLAVLGVLHPALGHAWGDVGHRSVAALAQARLNPTARAAVAELLRGESEASLPGVAVWADVVRKTVPEYRWSVPLHWVNFTPGVCEYKGELNCPDGLCVVAAVERYSSELGDSKLPRERRVIALKFLVHFVGDIHQPLHAGFEHDRGGNTFQISYRRKGWNLHSVWDTLLVESLGLDWSDYTRRLERIPMTMTTRKLLGESAVARWAEESCRVSHAPGFYPPGHKINRAYIESRRPVADQRIKLAGERLARLLNEKLGR